MRVDRAADLPATLLRCPTPPAVEDDPVSQDWEQQWAAFREEWGTPTIPPDGWDPEREAERLRRAVASIPATFREVDCSFHPCVAVLAGEEFDVDQLGSALSIGRSQMFVTDLWSETADIEVATVWMTPQEATADEVRWGRRLGDRLRTRLGAELTALVEPDEPAAD